MRSPEPDTDDADVSLLPVSDLADIAAQQCHDPRVQDIIDRLGSGGTICPASQVDI